VEAERTPVPTGTKSGIEAVDRVIDAVSRGDEDGLLALLRSQKTACTTQTGAGGPPKCRDAREELVPDGTLIDAFPLSSCELDWHADLRAIVQRIFEGQPRLYAVVAFTGQLFNEPYLPQPTHAAVFDTRTPDGRPVGLMLLIESGSVVYVDWMCDGSAESMLANHPIYTGRFTLVLEGPSYR
jgi:hypothetical protein